MTKAGINAVAYMQDDKTNITTETTEKNFTETYWNLIQTLAWIYSGDNDFINRASNKNENWGSYKAEKIFADGTTRMVEISSDPPRMINIELNASIKGDKTFYETLYDAENDLLHKLQEGKITALGLANNKGDLQDITPQAWADLTFKQYCNDAKPYAKPRICHKNSTTWYELLFERKVIMKHWPNNVLKKNTKKSINATTKIEIKEGYIKYRNELNGKNANSKEDRDIMRKMFPDYTISDELIRELREKYVPENKRKAGRPKKQSPN